jgi:hypothetical protein
MSKEFNWPNPPEKATDNVPSRMTCVAEARKLSVSWYCRHDSILLQAPPIAIQRSVKETG